MRCQAFLRSVSERYNTSTTHDTVNQSLYLSDMTLQHMQLQQAEFGAGQTGHDVRLQLPKNRIYISTSICY